MLPYLIFAFLSGITKGTALLILGLIGVVVSILTPQTPMKKIESLTFVVTLICLRLIYILDDITLLWLFLALALQLGYVIIALKNTETTKAFLAGLFVFAAVSTITSGSYLPMVTITAPVILGLSVLYSLEAIRGDKRCLGKA